MISRTSHRGDSLRLFGFVEKRYAIGSKISFHFFIQSDVKPEPIVTRSHTFSRALCQLHIITSSFDWFTGLSEFFVIGYSDYFGF